MKRNYILLVGLVCFTLLSVHYYLLYFADKLSSITNYFVGVGVVPIVFGLLIGFVGVLFFSIKGKQKLSKYFYFPLMCVIASLILVLHTVYMMSVYG